MEKDYSRQKEDYYFAKEHGICVNCKTETAEPGKTLCLECGEKSRERNRKTAAQRTEEQKKVLYEKNAERNRRIYSQRKAASICTKCGKHKAAYGRTLCINCLTRKRRQKDRRWNNDIPRSERAEYGLCYVCGNPVCRKSEKLCQKHYNLYSRQMKHLNANPTENMIKAREEYAERFREFKQGVFERRDGSGQDDRRI